MYFKEEVYIAAVKRDDQWYIFNPRKNHPDPVLKGKVESLKEVKMLFYKLRLL